MNCDKRYRILSFIWIKVTPWKGSTTLKEGLDINFRYVSKSSNVFVKEHLTQTKKIEMIKLSTKLRNIAANSIAASLEDGNVVSNSYIQIFSGSRPNSPQDTSNEPILSLFNLASPAFGEALAGTITSQPITEDISVIATGRATWFRIYDKNDEAMVDGDITLPNGGGDLEFDNVDFVEGGTIIISNLKLTVPE